MGDDKAQAQIVNENMRREALSKVPEVTLVFWIIKIAATTLGETGGDTVTMTLNWGYLAGTAPVFRRARRLVAAQICAQQFHPLLYWATIVASTTFGTTMADFADRSLGIGYTGGSTLLLACLRRRSACGTGRKARCRSTPSSRRRSRLLLGHDHLLADARHRARRLDRRYRRPRL